MTKKLLTLQGILLIACMLMIASCSKTGPAGATGPAGVAGPAGSQGPTGATGSTGTANVIYSAWLNVSYVGSDSLGWQAQISAPKLTDSILNTGSMKVYFNYGSDSANSALVFELPLDGNLGLVAEPYFETQLITIIGGSDLSSYTDNGNHYFQYRYILVPGGTTALPSSVNGGKTNIDWSDYNQVKKLLGLKD
jgi:hypothetical protein